MERNRRRLIDELTHDYYNVLQPYKKPILVFIIDTAVYWEKSLEFLREIEEVSLFS